MNNKLYFLLPLTFVLACATPNKPADVQPTQEAPTDSEPVADAPVEDVNVKEAPASDEPVEPRGDCITDISAHVSGVLSERIGEDIDEAWIADRTRIEEIEDLDGDGARDTRVIAFAYAYNLEAVVYLSSSGCPRMAGAFLMTSMDIEETSSHGVRDLSTWTKGGCAGLSGDITRYAYDPETKRYRSSSHISCGCDESEEGRDAACPSSGAP